MDFRVFGSHFWGIAFGETSVKQFRVEGLTLMIRATRSRSSRPNHMRSLLDALQTLRPVNLRRLPSGFHSVAKQASFCVAFQSDFNGFWEGFFSNKIQKFSQRSHALLLAPAVSHAQTSSMRLSGSHAATKPTMS